MGCRSRSRRLLPQSPSTDRPTHHPAVRLACTRAILDAQPLQTDGFKAARSGFERGETTFWQTGLWATGSVYRQARMRGRTMTRRAHIGPLTEKPLACQSAPTLADVRNLTTTDASNVPHHIGGLR